MSQQHVDSETEVVVHGRHVDLSTRFRDHVVEKLARVGKFGVPIARAARQSRSWPSSWASSWASSWSSSWA